MAKASSKLPWVSKGVAIEAVLMHALDKKRQALNAAHSSFNASFGGVGVVGDLTQVFQFDAHGMTSIGTCCSFHTREDLFPRFPANNGCAPPTRCYRLLLLLRFLLPVGGLSLRCDFFSGHPRRRRSPK